MQKSRKKLGRGEETSPEDLNKTSAALQIFLEDEWGRIGLELQRARKPDDVLFTLKLVKGAEFRPAFRDFKTSCLLVEGSKRITAGQLRVLRKHRDELTEIRNEVVAKQQRICQQAHKANVALNVAIDGFRGSLHFFEPFWILSKVAAHLRVRELSSECNQLSADWREVEIERQTLEESILAGEGWYARNQLIEFVHNTRYRKDRPVDFAMAMAGLPRYTWLYSIRKCQKIQLTPIRPRFNYQLFEMLQSIVKTIKKLDWMEIERRLEKRLLNEETDESLRAYIAPKWGYMKLAIAYCRGKKFKRLEIPYRIMARYSDLFEQPATALERELAERDALTLLD